MPSVAEKTEPSRSSDDESPNVTARREGQRMVLEFPLPSSVDAIRPVTKLAEKYELEPQGLSAFIAKHRIRTEKIGRQICVRESDLLAVFDRDAAAPKVVKLAAPESISPRTIAAQRLASGAKR